MNVKTLFLCLLLASLSAHGIEDPTQPQTSLKRSSQKSTLLPELTSILYSTDRKWAVINGEVLTEGELINGFELSAIERHQVVLVRHNKSLKLSLDSLSPVDSLQKEVFNGSGM